MNQYEVLAQEATEREYELKNRVGFVWLEKIVDDRLSWMKENGLMRTPAKNILEEMLSKEVDSDLGWKDWKPIESKITGKQLDDFENIYKVKLPKSYRHYLQYKHFYNLYLENRTINLPNNLPQKEPKMITDKDVCLNGFIDKGLVYFADYDDYGFLCFDTTKMDERGECPIFYFDHEEFYLPEHLNEKSGLHRFNSFEELLVSKNKN